MEKVGQADQLKLGANTLHKKIQLVHYTELIHTINHEINNTYI